jgi:hypothetical protein
VIENEYAQCVRPDRLVCTHLPSLRLLSLDRVGGGRKRRAKLREADLEFRGAVAFDGVQYHGRAVGDDKTLLGIWSRHGRAEYDRHEHEFTHESLG